MISNSDTRFGLIRHAQTVWNSEKRIQGQLDSPLTERGKHQATLWGRVLRKYQWDRILCSDLGRAQGTAIIINRLIGVPLGPESGLREQAWGRWSGFTLTQLSHDRAEDLAEQTRWGWQFCPPGGEDRKSVLERGRQTLELAAVKWPGKSILVVTHEGIIKCLVYHLLQRRFLPTEPRVLRPAHLHFLIAKQGDLIVEKINALDLNNG